jgi:hypothetical protein
MSRLAVEAVRADGRRVACDLAASGDVARFLAADECWTEYDVDVGDVPAALLVVPTVTTLAPVAWASDATLRVPVLDERFEAALRDVKRAYARLYPDAFAPDRGRVVADRRTTVAEPQSGDRSAALLFSGGLDSAAAALAHGSATLVTVHGSDVGLANRDCWRAVRDETADFAASHGTTHRTVTSNFREVLAYHVLDAHFRHDLGRPWWGAVHYQTGLPGLCAPLAFAAGFDRVFEASGYTADPTKPGDQPYVVSSLGWGETAVEMVDVETSRQEKAARVADHVRETGLDVAVRSCARDPDGGNCADCEKCYRTMAALAVEELDVSDHGFSAAPLRDGTVRRDLLSGAVELDSLERRHWAEIQRRTRTTDADPGPGTDAFFAWLADADLGRFAVERGSSPLRETFYETVRRLPYPVDGHVARAASRVKATVTGRDPGP